MSKGFIGLIIVFFIFGMFSEDTETTVTDGGERDYSANVVYVEDYKYRYVGADGHQIKLVNNNNAVDPTYAELRDFIDDDCTDDIKYNESSFTCGDFAEKVHNNAEKAGIKAGWVGIDFTSGPGHACNAFNTVDEGLVFIDCTASDKRVNIVSGQSYIPERMSRSNVEYMSMGIVSDFEIYW